MYILISYINISIYTYSCISIYTESRELKGRRRKEGSHANQAGEGLGAAGGRPEDGPTIGLGNQSPGAANIARQAAFKH